MKKSIGLVNSSSTGLIVGQDVIVAARWVLVCAAMVFALWLPAAVAQLRVQAFLILLLAMGNFFLHAQVLRRKPAADWIVYAASAGDLFAITILLTVQGGFASDLYIFYFPAVLAYSVAFPAPTTSVYTLVAVAAYSVIAVFTAPVDGLLVVGVRCLMIVAVAVCGSQYRLMEQRRSIRAEQAGAASLAVKA